MDGVLDGAACDYLVVDCPESRSCPRARASWRRRRWFFVGEFALRVVAISRTNAVRGRWPVVARVSARSAGVAASAVDGFRHDIAVVDQNGNLAPKGASRSRSRGSLS